MIKKSKDSGELKSNRDMYISQCYKFGGYNLPVGTHYTAGWNDASEILDAVAKIANEAEKEVIQLRDVLAERDAEIVVLKGTLDMWLLSTIKDRGDYAAERSFTREALSTPPSTSYLEQWERERYGDPRSYLYKIYVPNGDTAWTTELRNRECLEALPLYARKD